MVRITRLPMQNLPIGQRNQVIDHLLQNRLVDDASVARAKLIADRTGRPIEQVLNSLGELNDEALADAYACVTGCRVWNPDVEPMSLDPESIGVTVGFLRRARIALLKEDHGQLLCATCDPIDDDALSGLAFATGKSAQILIARQGDFRRVFDARYPDTGLEDAPTDERRLERDLDRVSDDVSEGPGSRLVASALDAAIERGASDIHFEPRRNDFRVRLRVDGRLVEYRTVSPNLAAAAVSRVKVLANLDLGERRLPQDGRTTFVSNGRPVDVRVATSPTVFGETAVLRILDRSSIALDLDALGFAEREVEVLKRVATAPHGLFLVTGPTGSGKTTTLYSMLARFSGSTKKVLSVEDPVEFHFDHVSQTQVAPTLGLTFATALRAFLRQDPDVIMVGEIRDPETAAVAVQAAMTGHFVLASIHANDVLGVIPRLVDMGVEPYQLAASFRGAAAQRLVRRLCPICTCVGSPTEGDVAFLSRFGRLAPVELHRPVGCPQCQGTGFKGRTMIAEAFISSERFLRAIAESAPAGDLAEIARDDGLGSMAEDGADKAILGITTLEEVLAAAYG